MKRQFVRRRCLSILWWLVLFDISLIALFSLASLGNMLHIANLETPLQWLVKIFDRNENTTNKVKYSISLIFHQTYSNSIVPNIYERYITSLASHHCIRDESHNLVNFENQTNVRDDKNRLCYYYVFWSDSSIMELVRDRFPHLEKLFQNYPRLERSDAARYLILHEFGGIYSDMDNEFVRPIDSAIEWGFPSLFAHLPYIRQWPTLRPHLECTLMMSVPRHPFLRLLIDSIESSRNAPDVYWRTGPEFLTQMHQRYLSSDANRTLECKRDPTSRRDCVVVPLPTRLFYPYIAGPYPHQKGPLDCKKFFHRISNPQKNLTEAERVLFEECTEWASRNYSVQSDVGSLPSETLVAHHSRLVGYRSTDDDPGLANRTSLTSLVPTALVYTAGGRFVRLAQLPHTPASENRITQVVTNDALHRKHNAIRKS